MMTNPAKGAARPLLSRDDQEQLKRYDRQQVLDALGSFDERGLNEKEFILRTAELLDPAQVPGLRDGCAAGDALDVLAAVLSACKSHSHCSDAPETTPKASPELIAAADAVLENRFNFYEETHQLPADIDWDANPGTAHWGHNLNRFTYLIPLTEAFLATGDSRYSQKALALILDWIAKCDIGACFTGTPYAFGSYLNNALHCSAWVRCMNTLLACDQVPAVELIRVLKSLHEQLAYLEIITNGHQGNWPIIGCNGMLWVLAAYPLFRETDRFADYCAHTMSIQIADQVLPDGVQDELTSCYHLWVVQYLLESKRSLDALGKSLDRRTLETLGKMVHYLQQTITPDGGMQVAFNDSDALPVPGIFAELARAGLPELLTPPERLGPECFPYAGVAFLRQRQNQGDLYLAFDAGPYGRQHQHEDRLGFWLFANGRSLIVDPGRHLYDWSDVSYLPYLCSTAAHSTLRIDGLEQNSRSRPETWIAREPLEMGWQVTAEESRARGVYDLGYGPENAVQVVHRREIVFVRERYWIVFDAVDGQGEHHVESRFQFAPGTLTRTEAGVHTNFPHGNLMLQAVSTHPFTDVRIECGRENPRSGWYSASYGKIEPSPTLALHTTAHLPLRVATLLFPYPAATPPIVRFTFDSERAVVETPEHGSQSVASQLW